MSSFLHTHADRDLQTPARAAVIIPTTLRPSLEQTVRSVFAQDITDTIQILIGIDTLTGDLAMLDRLVRDRPEHCILQLFYPGYSTASRHGGLHAAGDGGALRCLLTNMANSRYVAYLDDDNWWAPDHLSSLLNAMAGANWAFSLRWFIHPQTDHPFCVDHWESVGPGQGIFAEKAGGFTDPSTLMIDKLACAAVVPWWNTPMPEDPHGMTADRNVFAALLRCPPWAATNRATAYYRLDTQNPIHALRRNWMGQAFDQLGHAPDQLDQHSTKT